QILFKGGQLGRDRLRGIETASQSISRLESISGDAEYCRLFWLDAALLVKLPCGAHGDTACGLGEDAFGFSQKGNAFHDFRIACIFRPSAASGDHLRSIETVSRIADRQRACNGRRLLRLNLIPACLDCTADRTATSSLRTKELHVLFF